MFHHTEMRIIVWVPAGMNEVRERGGFSKPYFQEYMKGMDWGGRVEEQGKVSHKVGQ